MRRDASIESELGQVPALRAGAMEKAGGDRSRLGGAWDRLLLGIALCATPASIAVTEIFLFGSLLGRIRTLVLRQAKLCVPRIFWFWLAWTLAEVLVWLRSYPLRTGLGEMRHQLLIAALFLVLPELDRIADRVAVWRGIFATATLSSVFLIATFFSRLLQYRTDVDPVVYLRNGGLLHHWMIYGTIEILVFGGLLEFWRQYPEQRRWSVPVLVINGVAIVLSLTRMLWICSFLLLTLHLLWRRSRWIWTIPLLPCAAFLLAPGPVQQRARDSLHPDYYSNAERIQMLRVGWRMIRSHPMTGVGPGKVEELYISYLSPGEAIPAYHGHLHNNMVQLAAQFGIPVTCAAVLFVVFLFRELLERRRRAMDADGRFLSNAAMLGLLGFLGAGMFDYTFGHSLALILTCFVVLPPSQGERQIRLEDDLSRRAPGLVK